MGVGENFVQPEVLWSASYADYVYYNYKYNGIQAMAPKMAQAVNAGLILLHISCWIDLTTTKN